jgi:hypothetical protein
MAFFTFGWSPATVTGDKFAEAHLQSAQAKKKQQQQKIA